MFDSGVMVVQLQSHSEEEMIASALDNVSSTQEPEEGHWGDFNWMYAEMHSRQWQWGLKLCTTFPSLLSVSQDPLSRLFVWQSVSPVCLNVFPVCLVFLHSVVSVRLNVSVSPLQVTDRESLTSEEFAKLLGLSVLLSKERSVPAVLRFHGS